MDADLFMECEEEELEPWQQQPSMEEPVGNAESNTFTSETNTAEPKTMVIQSLPPVVNAVSTVPLLTKPLTPQVVSADIPKPVQGQQVILTPSGGGLSTVALSQVLLPGTSPITNAANSQPFYFTTQGLPVQNIHTLQPGQSPMGLVLNVQQGQTVRPITLVQAPGTQIFKPAVGSTQIITQPAQIRGAAPIASVAQTPTSFSTVQIPATLTIRTTTGVTLPTVNSLSTMSSTTAQPSAQRTTTKILTIKPGTSPLELQNLMSLVKSVNLPGGAQAQTFVVMNHQKTNGPPVVSSAVPSTPPTVVQTIPVTNTVQSSYHSCPRCGAQFKMIEALRSHMCFCCPDAGTAAKGRTTPASNTLATQTLPKTLVVVPKVNTESSSIKGEETQSRLVMLVDDFYYGTFEGNRVYVPMDNLKEPLPFRCLTCNKKLKNNIRLMTHMRYHVELDQQNGEMGTHTSCQHCFRHFPTPFRLQCHLESVHTAVESSTTCKICEWSFESEPVFLQHMKNTHKPGEMPYVCQVCEYRSSFYPDVLKHFHTWHEDTRHLLCQYCLKVFKHSSSYQKHYVCHQKSTVYHCNKCRLQFLFTKDKVEHKVNHHKTFRKPRELEGLQPGTKVTIRAYVGQKKTSQSSSKTPVTLMNSIASSQPVNSGDQQSQKQGPGRKQVSRMFGYIVNFQEQRALLGRHKCVECTFEVPDFANHYPTYVHCSLCFYSTCCSRAYANHMINNHVAGRMAKASKRGPPSGLKLSCAECAYSTSVGNLMAKHMAKFRGHSSCIFTRRGNPRVGFVAPKREGMPYALDRRTKRFKAKREVHPSEDSKNSPCGADSEDQNVDQEMAPLEDTDMDTDTAESDVEPQEILNRQKGAIEVANSTLSHPAKDRDEPLSIHQRRILLLALCGGIQKASNEMSTKPNLIQSWLRDKEKQLDEVSCSRRGEAFDRLVEWVLAQREQQFPISEAKLFEKTSEMQSQTNESDSFRISYEWAVSFMLQNKLGLDVPISEHRELPHAMEENCQRFTEFVHGQIKTNNIQQCMIGAMDQLSIFVDFNLLNENTSISNEKAFQLTGSGKPFVKIYLTVLADGTVMPAMVFTTKAGSKLSERLPDSVLLMAKEEALSGTEEIEVWAARVWKQHPDWQSEKEAMLVMDSHHTRVSEDFISTVRSAKTLPAIVPVGCTGRHQPLEMCVRPVLQRLLLARWAQRSASDGTSEVQPEDVVQLLVTWLGEAMSCFSRKPEFIQHSFCLARLIPDHSQEEHTNLPGNPLELINLLLDAVSGPEVVEIDSADEEEPMETCTVSKTNLVEEPIDLTEEPEIVENEDDQTDDEDKTPTERNKIESQTQERTEDCLEIASESTDISQSSPKSDAGSNNSEQDNFSESCQDLKEPHQDPIEHRQDPTEHHQDPNEPRQDPNEPRQDPNEPRQDPTEPRQDPTEPRQDPTEPRQDPTEPRQDPSEHRKDPSEHRKDPSEPRQDPNEPRQDPIGPRQDPNEPRQDPMEPRQDPMEPRQDPTEPCQDPTEPCQDPTEPCQDPTEPCLDPTEPCLDPTEPRQDSNEPRQDPIGPRQDPIGPRQDPNEPRQDPDADQTDSASNR
ncbi:pogo transposable element with ZNF domain isoform X2 [Triplophysa rosa]|uniref:pogo transposable element with ZNF domain isoform X2 n=1 Tax=Triplophysa rosa TaxID=992332 RepID=UPI00254629D3|nr:pogo transposable element with ZNF domain isoform X2 [Triplophysa rosa]